MSNFTLQVTVQVDVQNAESIQQARESVFALLSAPKESKSKRGRPTVGPKATVTGIQIPSTNDTFAVTSTRCSSPSPMEVRSFPEIQVEVTETTP